MQVSFVPASTITLQEQLARAEAERAQAQELAARYKKAYDDLLIAYERMKRQLFGQKAERLSPEQQAFAWEAALKQIQNESVDLPRPPDPPDANDPKRKKSSRKPTGRRNLEELDLPEEVIEIVPPILPEDAARIGEDVTYRIEHQGARKVRIKIVRPIYKVPAVDATAEPEIVQAEPPHEMIPKGMLGPGLLSRLFVSKWLDHIPFHRQEDIFRREDFPLDRATMCRAAVQCAELAKGIVDACWNDAIEHAAVFATDATGVLVKQPNVCRRGHFFVAIADDDYVFFQFTAKHNHTVPLAMFRNFTGYVQADACAVYDALFREPDGPTEVGCMAHCRRKFMEAVREAKTLALTGLGFIQGLFAIEKEIKKLPPEKRRAIRQRRAKSILDEFFSWCERQVASREKDRSLLGRAIRYALRHREALSRYVNDGRLKLTNNDSERELRRIAVGRNNWIFVGSDEHAEDAAVFISLLASCRLHKLNPEQYLRDLFRVLPQWPASRLLELAPRSWTFTRARLNADQLRIAYGDITIPPAPVELLRHKAQEPNAE